MFRYYIQVQEGKIMRRSVPCSLILCLFVLLTLSTENPALAQSNEIADLIITNVDASAFPDVNVQVRMLDAQGKPVANVANNTIEVLEDGRSTAATLATTNGSVWVHFVVDAGVSINMAGEGVREERWQTLANTITDFVQDEPWMQSNLDRVAITVVEPEGAHQIADFSTSGEELATRLAAYQPPYRNPGLTTVGHVLLDTLEAMTNNSDATGQAQFIVLLSYSLDAYTNLQQAGEEARSQGIPIYVGLTGSGDSEERVNTLATVSGGSYVNYRDDPSLASLYRPLIAHRQQYTLTYRSSTNQSGLHQIEVLTRNPGSPTPISEITTYELNSLEPPTISIDNPKPDQKIPRQADQYTPNPTVVLPTFYKVIATVRFTDEHPRLLRLAELYNGTQKLDTVENPGQYIEFNWDLRNVQQGTTSFSLFVKVTDELGFVENSPPVAVTVELIIPTPTPVPTPTPAIGPTVTPTPIPCLDSESEIICRGRQMLENTRNWLKGNLGLALGLSSFVIALIALGIAVRKGKVQQIVNSPIVRGAVDQIRKTLRLGGPTVARAYIVLLEGDINIGRRIDITGTTGLGHSWQHAQITFQRQEIQSVVSSLHCTILDEETHFALRDEASTNGTFLNNIKLEELQVMPLKDGDVIELGQVERGGVRLRFHIAEEASDPLEGRITNRLQEEVKVTGKIPSRDQPNPVGSDAIGKDSQFGFEDEEY
jgi:hypothetical protein